MSRITETDWNRFQVGYEALVERDAALRRAVDTNDAADVQASSDAEARARSAWDEVHNLTEDLKARAIAAYLLGRTKAIPYEAKPLDRWAGGSLKDKGAGTYKDYPDVWLGPFP